MLVEKNTMFGARIAYAADAEGGAAAPAPVPAADTPAPADAPVADDLLGDTPAAKTGEGKADAPDKAAPAEDDDDDLLNGKVKEGEDEKPADGEGDYEITVPEGYEADAELAATFKPIAKELGLTQDQAQGLVEKYAPQMLAQMAEKQAQQWKQVQAGYAKDAKADPEIFDAKANAVRPEVAVARDYLGADFTAAVKLHGMSNHPAVLKALAKVGKALGEDVPGFGTPPKAQTTAAQRLYPNDQPKGA